MTKQAVFNKVVKHLLTQKEQARDDLGCCTMITLNGKRCAVGCLILKKDSCENVNKYTEARDLINAGYLSEDYTPHLNFLGELQNIHDGYPDKWQQTLTDLAQKHNLKMPVSSSFTI